ncbi:hypothetical protein HN587_03240 [Candidatus Woesearchaeota archaeon]|jgi:hypothetical protein|nr:hypothetical protein [Candidatus Woesearchaeota archaeon]
MDIDKVKQINDLARDLLRHGMAKSMSEAVTMAERQISAQGTGGDLKDLRSETTINVSPASTPNSTPGSLTPETTTPTQQGFSQPQPTPSAPPQNQEHSLILKTTVGMVNTHATRLESMQNRIDQLDSQIRVMREELSRINNNPVQVLKTEQKNEHETAQTTFKPQPKPPEKKPSPRSGNYEPGDVSIEEIFYAGTR